MPKLSVVILNYNGIDYLKKFLPSVMEYSSPHEVIVADNCSTDHSVNFLKKNFPSVRIISNTKNQGYSQGYNEALEQVDSDYYVLLNSDVEVTKNWIDPILNQLEENLQIAAVQPKILDFNNKLKFEYAGAGGGMIDTLGYPFCRGRLFQTLEEDQGQYNDIAQIFWASGACLFIRAKVYKESGGLDTDFFAHMEEIDMCWRINAMGYKVMYNGLSCVYHVGGGTLERTNPKKTYLNFRNGLSLLYKNYTLGELLYKLPARIILDVIAAIKFMLFDGFHNGIAVFKAHIHFLLEFPLNFKKRRAAKRLFKPVQISTIYARSLVWDYYIRGIRKFSDLQINSTK
ncbi:MAG: glycosyltransferase family 2 protein [Bacteroidota bacterium]